MKTVILSYNHPELTCRTILSALKYTSNILLVHNGSLATHRDRLIDQFPNIEHHIISENVGYSGGANKGLLEAFKKSPWALFLTNDCTLEELPPLPALPGIYCPVIYKRAQFLIDSVGAYFEPKKGRLVHCRSSEDFIEAKKTKKIYAPGSAFLVHQSVFEATGGFDETYGTYWEDVDWSLRATQLGYVIELLPQFTVRHGVGKTCHKNSDYTIYYFQRNRKRLSFKHNPKIKDRLHITTRLAQDWTRLALQLTQKKRYSDLRKLMKAIID